jgi:methyltransferase (TIGR00027 family)
MDELMGLFWVMGSGVVGLLVLAFVSFLFAQKAGRLRNPAHAFAALRTLGTQEEDALVKCQDDLAHLFAPSFLGHTSFIRKFGVRFLYPGLYETVLATTRVGDNIFSELLNQNHFKGDPSRQIQQVVVLGADYGTRLIRFSQLLKDRGVKAFEVDLFQYQQYKLKTLGASAQELKKNLYSFDSIQFRAISVQEIATLQHCLGSSFQTDKPTLWILDGVLPFLSAEMVDSLLATIRSISGENCCVMLETVPKLPALTDSMSMESYTYTEQAVAALRSLFPKPLGNFELDMTQASKWCRARGFELMKNIGPQTQQVQLIRIDGSMVGQVPDCLRLLVLASSAAPTPKPASQKADTPKAASQKADPKASAQTPKKK